MWKPPGEQRSTWSETSWVLWIWTLLGHLFGHWMAVTSMSLDSGPSVVGGRCCESLQAGASWWRSRSDRVLRNCLPLSHHLPLSVLPVSRHILSSFFGGAHQHHPSQSRNRSLRRLHLPPTSLQVSLVLGSVSCHGGNVFLCALLQGGCGPVFPSSTVQGTNATREED